MKENFHSKWKAAFLKNKFKYFPKLHGEKENNYNFTHLKLDDAR